MDITGKWATIVIEFQVSCFMFQVPVGRSIFRNLKLET